MEHDPIFGIPLETLRDLHGNFCRASQPLDNYYGRRVAVVADTENPVTHYFHKWFTGLGTVSRWELEHHPEWYELR